MNIVCVRSRDSHDKPLCFIFVACIEQEQHWKAEGGEVVGVSPLDHKTLGTQRASPPLKFRGEPWIARADVMPPPTHTHDDCCRVLSMDFSRQLLEFSKA